MTTTLVPSYVVYEDAQKLMSTTTRMVEVTDHKSLGTMLRGRREKQHISLRQMAGLMDISAPYLSDLERGRRNWSIDLVVVFLQGVKSLS